MNPHLPLKAIGPDSIVEGYGTQPVSLHTPEVMRDCIRKHYWIRFSELKLHTSTLRLADDLKRRGFSKEATTNILLSRLLETSPAPARESISLINKTIVWVFSSQAHPLTCTGILLREGICQRHEMSCRFYEIDQEKRKPLLQLSPQVLPHNIEHRLQQLHPAHATYAIWTYRELFRIEQERHLIPGNHKEPILVGFRALAARISTHYRTPGYDKDAAARSIRLLIDADLVKKVEQGRAGAMARKANGYIRIIPMSGKYNTESDFGPTT